MARRDSDLILCLETGLGGGSVAVFEAGELIGFTKGSAGASKSEDLLMLIDELLERLERRREAVRLIAVSDEPGSLTGLRIGLATARGLAAALSAEIEVVPVLEALVRLSNARGLILSAVFSEKSGIFYRRYQVSGAIAEPVSEISKEKDLQTFKGVSKEFQSEGATVVFDDKLFARLNFHPAAEKHSQIIIIDSRDGNFAQLIGKAIMT